MKNKIINLVVQYQEPAFKLATVVTITALFGSLIIQAICMHNLN